MTVDKVALLKLENSVNKYLLWPLREASKITSHYLYTQLKLFNGISHGASGNYNTFQTLKMCQQSDS